MRNILKILILLVLSCCELPCAEIRKVTDLGALPEDVIDYLPYEQDDIVNFKYSDGTITGFEVTRETEKQYQYYRDECSDLTTVYEINITNLVAGDSIPEMLMWITNLGAINWYDARIAGSRFRIPVSEEYLEVADISDSMLINAVYYYEVIRLLPDPPDPSPADSARAEVLYFNRANGILEVLMSDGGNWQLQN